MTDADVATRAPESDAAEDPSAAEAQPAVPPPTSATAPTPAMCDDCVTDRPTPAGRTPAGEVRKLGDVDAYVSKPSEYPHAPARLLLLLTGGTGMRSTNNQIQADMYADEGFVVVMPDLFGGDVAPNTATSVLDPNNLDGSREGNDPSAPLVDSSSSSSLLGLFKIKAVETVKSFMIDMWLARHTEAKVLPILHRVLDASRAEFADAVSSGDGVYAVGYCFGGRYVLLLSRMPENTGGQESAATSSGSGADVDLEAGTAPPPKQNRPLIKVGALAHATLVSPDDFTGLQAPISMVCVESDPMFPDEVRTVGEDYLSKHNVEHEVQVYPGVPHGFAVYGEYADENIRTAQATAFEQMVKWLHAH